MGTCNEVHIAYVQDRMMNFLLKGVKMLDYCVTIIVNNLSLEFNIITLVIPYNTNFWYILIALLVNTHPDVTVS